MIVSVPEAIRLLQSGEVVGIPTETVYGLAGSIAQENAIKKIFTTKERPYFDPLIVHACGLEQLDTVVAELPPSALKLAQAFWPGPLTLILKKKKEVSDLITAGLPHVGVRCPNHPLTLEILKKTGPLAAPSANKFGKTSPTTASHVENEFESQVAVVDGGPCHVGIESSVVRVEETPDTITLHLLRPGAVDEKELRAALAPLKKTITFQRTSSAAAPGQLENHYQPETPLVLSEVDWSEDLHASITRALLEELNAPLFWDFGDKAPEWVARSFYAEMREKSQLSLKHKSYIFLKVPQAYNTPAWEALRDRLEKASTAFVKILQGKVSVLVKGR